MLPWTSEKWVRSLGVLPAPEIPDFASMMIPGSSSDVATSGCRPRTAAVREQPGHAIRRASARPRLQRSVRPYTTGTDVAAEWGYHFCREAASVNRKAPDRHTRRETPSTDHRPRPRLR